jgi:hypothetical protein
MGACISHTSTHSPSCGGTPQRNFKASPHDQRRHRLQRVPSSLTCRHHYARSNNAFGPASRKTFHCPGTDRWVFLCVCLSTWVIKQITTYVFTIKIRLNSIEFGVFAGLFKHTCYTYTHEFSAVLCWDFQTQWEVRERGGICFISDIWYIYIYTHIHMSYVHNRNSLPFCAEIFRRSERFARRGACLEASGRICMLSTSPSCSQSHAIE